MECEQGSKWGVREASIRAGQKSGLGRSAGRAVLIEDAVGRGASEIGGSQQKSWSSTHVNRHAPVSGEGVCAVGIAPDFGSYPQNKRLEKMVGKVSREPTEIQAPCRTLPETSPVVSTLGQSRLSAQPRTAISNRLLTNAPGTEVSQGSQAQKTPPPDDPHHTAQNGTPTAMVDLLMLDC